MPGGTEEWEAEMEFPEADEEDGQSGDWTDAPMDGSGGFPETDVLPDAVPTE